MTTTQPQRPRRNRSLMVVATVVIATLLPATMIATAEPASAGVTCRARYGAC